MIRVPLRDGRTLHHDGRGHFGAGNVTLRSAPAGTGIIAGAPCAPWLKRQGLPVWWTSSVGTSNPLTFTLVPSRPSAHHPSPSPVSSRPDHRVSDLSQMAGGYDKGRVGRR